MPEPKVPHRQFCAWELFMLKSASSTLKSARALMSFFSPFWDTRRFCWKWRASFPLCKSSTLTSQHYLLQVIISYTNSERVMAIWLCSEAWLYGKKLVTAMKRPDWWCRLTAPEYSWRRQREATGANGIQLVIKLLALCLKMIVWHAQYVCLSGGSFSDWLSLQRCYRGEETLSSFEGRNRISLNTGTSPEVTEFNSLGRLWMKVNHKEEHSYMDCYLWLKRCA